MDVQTALWVGKYLITNANSTLVEMRLDNLALSNGLCELLGEFLMQPTCRLQVRYSPDDPAHCCVRVATNF